MQGKKELLARISAVTGMTKLIELAPKRPCLLILNYHRVGEADRTPYDSGTYSCTTAEFDWQVQYLKSRFRIVTLPEAVDFVHGRAVLDGPCVLLTFDDGYLDNYEEAFPVLRRQQVSATFFLPTGFVGTGLLPWWDTIAFIVKGSKRNSITLNYPEPATFDLSPAARKQSIIGILNQFKKPSVTDTERFISELESLCDCTRPGASDRCFLTWQEAREMQSSGMCFGSHTHSHEILSKLPFAQQVEEVQLSRAIMERELGKTIDTLAYPVGKATSFSPDTVKALQETLYTTAFSFKGGVNAPGAIEPFDVARTGVDGEDRSVFRLRVTSLASMGKSIF